MLVRLFLRKTRQLKTGLRSSLSPLIFCSASVFPRFVCIQLAGALFHFFESCHVGVALLGPDHPNVRSKLREFAMVLRQIGKHAMAERLDNGRVDFREKLEKFVELFTSFPNNTFSTASAEYGGDGGMERWVAAEVIPEQATQQPAV